MPECRRGSLTNRDCGTQSLVCPTCSVRGNCCCKVRVPGPTTQFEHCLLNRRTSMLWSMTRACGEQRWPFWVRSQAQHPKSVTRRRWPLFPCAWAVWVCDLQAAAPQQRIGPRGPTRSRWSTSAIHLSLTWWWRDWAVMALLLDALPNFTRLRADWRGKAFGGSQVGQIFRVERDRRKQWRVNLGSGNMGGNIGLLPSLTRISGRGPCWPAVPPLAGPTSVHILVGTRALHWRTAQQHQSSPFPPHLFRTLLLERLQLPLQITEAECEGCQAPLDPLGRHRASCTRSGRVKRRATAIERMTARVFREAGACVRQNIFLRDMNINVPAQDSRHIEVLARSAVFRRCTIGGRHHVAQCAQLQWWSPPTRRGPWRSRPGAGTSGQGDHLSRTCFFWEVQACGSGNRNWWEVERGGCTHHAAVGACQSSRGSIVHAIPCGAHVGTTLDQNVGCVLRSLLRRVSCGASAKHHLVSNGWGTAPPCWLVRLWPQVGVVFRCSFNFIALTVPSFLSPKKKNRLSLSSIQRLHQ